MKEIKNNQWHNVAHSMPIIGREVLFYFPLEDTGFKKFSEKIEIGRMETPKIYGSAGDEWTHSRASCDYYGAGRYITHWAEIGTQGVPNNTGFIFSMNMLCLNPITIEYGQKNLKRTIWVAEICGLWFYGFSWEYNNQSGYSSGCRPALGFYSCRVNSKTKEEAIERVLTFFREKEEQKTKKVTKQLNLF